MKWLRLAAIVLVALAGVEGKASETSFGHFGIPYWEPVGSWIVLLLPLGRSGMSCTALTRRIPAPGGEYSVGFALSTYGTHFYLDDGAIQRPIPDRVSLAVDGIEIARLKVLLDKPFASNAQLLVADVPGSMLVRAIIPAMVKGRVLQVAAGARHYTIPITDFGRIFTELRQCAVVALSMTPRISSNPG